MHAIGAARHGSRCECNTSVQPGFRNMVEQRFAELTLTRSWPHDGHPGKAVRAPTADVV